MNTFTYVLVTWRTNTNTIFQEATGENLSTFEYIWHLGKRFVVPHIQRMFKNSVGLQKCVVDKMRNILKAEMQSAR